MENLKDYQQGFLPGRSSIQRCTTELHALGQRTIALEKVNSDIGEMFQFNYEKMVRYLLRTFSLHENAQTESVELCITFDSIELSKDLCHVTFGMKVTDARAINP